MSDTDGLDRNESYFTSGEINDDVYDEVAEEYIQNRTGEHMFLREVPVSDRFRSLDSTSHKHGCIPESSIFREYIDMSCRYGQNCVRAGLFSPASGALTAGSVASTSYL